MQCNDEGIHSGQYMRDDTNPQEAALRKAVVTLFSVVMREKHADLP
jgi:hypothetical protein